MARESIRITNVVDQSVTIWLEDQPRPCTHTLGAPGAIRCADCQSEDARRALAATICRSCGLAGHLGECDLGWMRHA